MQRDTKFAADFLRMTGKKFAGRIDNYIEILFRHNLRFMWWYRKRSHPILGKFFRYKRYCFARKYGLEIHAQEIGRGLYLGHPYNITVGGGVVIGDYCSLHKGCTIGAENRGKRAGSPILGNRVYIGINSTVVGNVKIGDDVIIAPNAFVNFDVPKHSIVIGNPAVVHSRENATDGYINFCDDKE